MMGGGGNTDIRTLEPRSTTHNFRNQSNCNGVYYTAGKFSDYFINNQHQQNIFTALISSEDDVGATCL